MVDIEASARKHGVTDDDMLHALRNHWQAFETNDRPSRCTSVRP
ncbi:MAG: hypothetical protein ACR2JF_03475 [Iamia sp.]